MYSSIQTTEQLKLAIADLELQRQVEKAALIEQFRLTREGLQPVNLIKGIFKDMTHSSGLKDMIFNNGVGLLTGLLSKKLVFGAAHNPITKLLGTIFQFTVGNVVADKTDGLRDKVFGFVKGLFAKRKQKVTTADSGPYEYEPEPIK